MNDLLEDIVLAFVDKHRFVRGAVLVSSCLAQFYIHCKENGIYVGGDGTDNPVDILTVVERLVEEGKLKEQEYTEEETKSYRLKSLYYHRDIQFNQKV